MPPVHELSPQQSQLSIQVAPTSLQQTGRASGLQPPVLAQTVPVVLVQQAPASAQSPRRPTNGHMHPPFWHVPTLQAVPFALGLHLPRLQTFLPFFLWHLPFSHFAHSPQAGLHVPDFATVSSDWARPSRLRTLPRPPVMARRREPTTVRERVRVSKRSSSIAH